MSLRSIKDYKILSIICLVFAMISISCSAPPPVPTPVTVTTWKQMVGKDPSSPSGFKAQLSFQLWLAQSDQPSVDLLESRLSSSSVLADVNGSAEQYQVSIADLSCDLTWTQASATERSHATQNCSSQVKADQIELVKQSKGLIKVECSASSLKQALNAHQIASAMARNLEAVLTLPQAGLCKSTSKPKSFSVHDFIKINTQLTSSDEHQVCSQGLQSFSQPEVCFVMVDSSRVTIAQEALLSIVDAALRGTAVQEGLDVSRGPAMGILASASKVNERLKQSAPTESLIVVHPEASSTDREAQRALMMRFTTP